MENKQIDKDGQDPPVQSTSRRGLGSGRPYNASLVSGDVHSMSLASGISGISGVSGISGTSSVSSLQELSPDMPIGSSVARPHHHHHHHHPVHAKHMNLDKLKIRKKDEGNRRGAKVHAPKTLVVTMQSNLQDFEAHGNYLRQRSTDAHELAFEIIKKQIQDLGDLEWVLSDDAKLQFKRHIIKWRAAWSLPHRKILTKDTEIPLTATVEFYKPLTKCQRYCRNLGRICCTIQKNRTTDDLLKRGSLRKFLKASMDEKRLNGSLPSLTDGIKRAQQRRQHMFDSQFTENSIIV